MQCAACFALALIAALTAASVVRAEPLTDDAVVQLSRAGLSAQTIVVKIQTTPSQFDVSTGALLWLKRQAVADEVLLQIRGLYAGLEEHGRKGVLQRVREQRRAERTSGKRTAVA